MLMPHWCRQEGLCHLALHIRWCRRLQSLGRQPCFYFILPLFFFFFSALTKEDSLPGLAAVIPFAFQHPLCVVPFLVRSNKDKQLTLPFNFMSCNIFLLSSIPSGWAVEILHLRHLFFFFFPYDSSSLYIYPCQSFCWCVSGFMPHQGPLWEPLLSYHFNMYAI